MTNDTNKISFEEAYKKLHKSYMVRLENSIEAIDNIILQRQLGPVKKEALQGAMQLAHGLAGSGATFGFPDISTLAKKIDTHLDRVLTNAPSDKAISDAEFEEIEKMMQNLQELCKKALESKADPVTTKENNITPSRTVRDAQQFFVLVVDDDENISDLITHKLKQKNVRVLTARDGAAALALLSKEIPDLIILDIMMPGIDGHEVLRRIKHNPEYLKIPIIMLTAQTEQKDVVSALHAGAIDYMIKPVDMDQLIARVEKTLEASCYEIVVADNDQLLLQLLGNWYRERGFKVKLLDDGKKAWDYILAHVPDLVVLDRMMPGIEGLGVLTNMRNSESTQDIPVIILSARKQERDIAEAMKRGAQDYISKPFIPDELMERSLKLLKTRK